LNVASAQAATVTNEFCFAKSPSSCAAPAFHNASSASFTGSNGLVVNVTGTTYSKSGSNFVAGTQIDVENNSYGLISSNLYDKDANGNFIDTNTNPEHAIDSKGPDEAMVFDFGRVVTLSSIYFGWTAGAKLFSLFVDGTHVGNFTANAGLPTGVTGTTFAVGATKGWTGRYWRESYLKLKSITVSYQPSEIPLPASGLLLLGGLFGFAAVRRKARS
jgi:hypothetical protein